MAQAADLIGPRLVGETVERLGGSHPALRQNRTRMYGKRVTSVRAFGKHLLIDFDNGWTLRTHLGMTGVWHVYGAGERWRKTPGKARVVIDVGDSVAVCFAAPTVQLAPTNRIAVDHLGPDLMATAVAWDKIEVRAKTAAAATAADLLLDQRVMAGIGNVYKSETLFLEGVNPHTPAADLASETVLHLAKRARRLLLANRAPVRRSTTGARGDGANHWVYGRAGRPCRRCSAVIATDRHGELARRTYWCPACQPETAPQP